MSLPALYTLRSARIGLLLAALSLLSACAMVRLAYNNADTVLRVMASRACTSGTAARNCPATPT